MKREYLGSMKYKKAALGLVLIAVPGSGVAYGAYLLYKSLQKDPKSFKEWIDNVKKELKEDENNNTKPN